MNRISRLILASLLLPLSVMADNFEHCQPFGGFNVTMPFRFGPEGQTILEQRSTNPPVVKAVQGLERITYALPVGISTDPRSGKDTIRYETQTTYIQRRDDRPVSVTTYEGEIGRAREAHQEIFGYLPNGKCEIRQRVSWRQNGRNVENVLVEDSRLCPDLVQAVRAEIPEGPPSLYRPLQQQALDVRRCHDHIRSLAEIVKRFDSNLNNYNLMVPEVGEVTVRARVPGQLMNPNARRNPNEPMFLPPMPIDPNSVLALLAKVGTCRMIQSMNELSGVERRGTAEQPPRATVAPAR